MDPLGSLIFRGVGRTLVMVAAAVSLGGAASAAPVQAGAARVAGITHSPSQASSTLSLDATPRDSASAALNDRAVAWSSSNLDVATVSSTGVVTAVAPGSATMTAARAGASGTSAEAITALAPEPVASVTLFPTSITIEPGAVRTISAFIKGASGNLLSGRVLAWRSSNEMIARISNEGIVTAVAPGSATITATSEGKSGSAVVIVGVGGTSMPIRAPVRDPAPMPDAISSVSHNFEDGTFGPYKPGGAGRALDVVADPTGSGKGKVLRIRYTLTANPDKKILSADRALGLRNMRIGFGETRFFRGDFYVPAPSDDNRKLLRFDMKNSPAGNYLVVALWGTKLRVEGYSKGKREWFAGNLGSYAGDRWHTLEAQVTTNSAVGVRDGILRIWMDGSLVYEKTNSLWLDAGDSVATMRFGEQLSISANSSRDEYRYWDNVRFANSR